MSVTSSPSPPSPFVSSQPSSPFLSSRRLKTGSELLCGRSGSASSKPPLKKRQRVDSSSLTTTEIELKNVKKPTASDPLANATWEDVIVSEKAENPAARGGHLSRLVSIKGVEAKKINVNCLRAFASRLGVSSRVGKDHMPKQDLCARIAEAKDSPPVVVLVKKESSKKKEYRVNRKRLVNVLFSDEIKPKLALRGEKLTKDDLTAGRKQDERMWTFVAIEYNDIEKYNEDQYPEVGFKGDPSQIHGPITWKQAKENSDNIMNLYEKAYNNYHRSGNHGFEFGDPDDDADTDANEDNTPIDFVHFTGGKTILLYVHEFAIRSPQVMRKALAKLPTDAFAESTGDHDKKPASAKKKKRSPRKADETAEAIRELGAAKQKTQNAFEMKTLVKTQIDLVKSIRRDQEFKKKVLRDRANDFEKSFKYLNNGYNEYLKEDGDYPSSQESCYKQLKGVDDTIVEYEVQLAAVRKNIAAARRNSSSP